MKNFEIFLKLFKSFSYEKDNHFKIQNKNLKTQEKLYLTYKNQKGFFFLEYTKNKDNIITLENLYFYKNDHIPQNKNFHNLEITPPTTPYNIFLDIKINEKTFQNLKEKNGILNFFLYLTDEKRITNTKNLFRFLIPTLIKKTEVPFNNQFIFILKRNMKSLRIITIEKGIQSKTLISEAFLSEKFIEHIKNLNNFDQQFIPYYIEKNQITEVGKEILKSFNYIIEIPKFSSYHELLLYKKSSQINPETSLYIPHQNTETAF